VNSRPVPPKPTNSLPRLEKLSAPSPQSRVVLNPRSVADSANIFVADAHRDGGKRFVARLNERLTAFLELESAAKRG
jgi:hypothetical protein